MRDEVPARVVSVSAGEAIVEVRGSRSRVSVALLRDVRPGDWVSVRGELAIRRLPPADADTGRRDGSSRRRE